jgi:hypothetical protein
MPLYKCPHTSSYISSYPYVSVLIPLCIRAAKKLWNLWNSLEGVTVEEQWTYADVCGRMLTHADV